ncbi:hypothetical protein DNTS_002530 [Danionella cerebrum]|uniref:HECT domain-containing protein n=1 Tax=Danionella cerebrum TaxID=2873325 RepID=A0A553MSN9_9TELE|nr:hypothetical protein DNTS_002530 [Danionella translucida]
MLCYWGKQIREGLGLWHPDRAKDGKYGIKSVCLNSAIHDISVGETSIGFIQDGKVSILRLLDEESETWKKEHLQNNRITSIVCGEAGTVLLSDVGKVLITDTFTECRPLKGLESKHVIQIACGDQHSMALTNDGQLFVWGDNSHGQLGLTKKLSRTSSPQHLQSLSGIPAAQISAGGGHSFVLSISGAVYAWGKNSSGQLGLGDTTDRSIPSTVQSLNGKTVYISCGGEHTAALSKGGNVFTFGSGGSGQLGHDSFKDEHHPRLVAELWGAKVSQISCGRAHTLALVGSPNQIYSFGCGNQGQLGNGGTTNQPVPFPVALPLEYTNKDVNIRIFAGVHHSFVLLPNEPEPNRYGKILTLDERMIARWVSGGDAWATVKKEINTVFSSAACLNGSFLKTSCEEHHQTEHCGLDLNLVKTSFAKLTASKHLSSEVVKVIQQTLLPSLDPNPTGDESLRLYILLPELISGLKKKRTELAEALASKILHLSLAARKKLEMYWSELPDDWVQQLIRLFHKETSELIGQISCGEIDHELTRHLKIFLEVLQMVYEVCCCTTADISNHDFVVLEITDLLNTLRSTYMDIFLKEIGSQLFGAFNDWNEREDFYFRTIEILTDFPFAADFVSKQMIFTFLQERSLRNIADCEMFLRRGNLMKINRESILKDTLKYLRSNNHSFRHFLQVEFIEENGMDEGGLSAEFFSLLSKSLLKWDKKALEVHEDSLVWFNPHNTEGSSHFYHIGLICGMALYNRHYINICFPLALFKKLLHQKPTLKDLEELFPLEARCLKELLEEDGDVVDLLFLDFTVRGKEVIPNGGQIQVNKNNRKKYVDLYVDFVFNKSVKAQFENFSKGFSTGCPLNVWRMFYPKELQELLYGSLHYDWNELQQSASYEGCSASDGIIKDFWTVFFEFSEEDKKKFLMFMYGTERVPVDGFSKRSMKVSLVDFPDSNERLPETQICSKRLILPKYSNISTLRNKLTHAITYCGVFGRI